MSFEDPNREAVGLPPIWTGVEGGTEEPPPEGGEGTPVAFDPGDHTIDDVKTYVDQNPDQRSAVLSAEKAGKQRSTLIDWLAGSGG